MSDGSTPEGIFCRPFRQHSRCHRRGDDGGPRNNGTIISYDLNYRPSLWKAFGGQARAQEVNRRLAAQVDVILGNEEDFTACLGFEVPGTDLNTSSLDPANFKAMIREVTMQFPNLVVVATTFRAVKSATINDWGAVAWSREGSSRRRLARTWQILDRVGGGDSFASGSDIRVYWKRVTWAPRSNTAPLTEL